MTDTVKPEIDADPPAPSAPADPPSRTPWPALLTLLAGGAVVVLAAWDVPGTVRTVGVLSYLAAAPGLACARLIRIPDGLSQFVVGVALSLALGILVAQGMIHLHRWSPLLGLSTLAAVASIASLIELTRYGLARYALVRYRLVRYRLARSALARYGLGQRPDREAGDA